MKNVKFLNSNPVLVAWHFQHDFGIFLKEILLTPLISFGKVTYYAIRTEFQAWGLHHVRRFIWTLNSPKLNKEAMEKYIMFIDKVNQATLPSKEMDACLYQLVKLYISST